ncbi:hypothetical protein NDU88_006619 [Pleurodeles waltl]|uniref:Uncharacterized protein n=1 Tax=Pleurodeles waltl TaxID=8319 RepID=A0AAV7WD35_PLEWA|nr:hypothetical protein NDU88_006619 [Pleurodeles waltl]
MGEDPDARSPDFRVPDGVKRNDGLREGGEEESLDATVAKRRTKEPEDAASQNRGGAAGNSELPSTKSDPAERTNRKEMSIHRHRSSAEVSSAYQYRSTYSETQRNEKSMDTPVEVKCGACQDLFELFEKFREVSVGR